MPSTQTKDLWSTTKLKPPVLDFLALLSSIACIVSGAIFTVEDDKLYDMSRLSPRASKESISDFMVEAHPTPSYHKPSQATLTTPRRGSNDIGGVAGYVLFFPILSLIISILNLTLWFGKFKAAQLHPGWTLFVCIVQIGLSGLSLAIASFYDWFIVDAYGYGRGRGSEKYGRPWLACIGALEAV